MRKKSFGVADGWTRRVQLSHRKMHYNKCNILPTVPSLHYTTSFRNPIHILERAKAWNSPPLFNTSFGESKTGHHYHHWHNDTHLLTHINTQKITATDVHLDVTPSVIFAKKIFHHYAPIFTTHFTFLHSTNTFRNTKSIFPHYSTPFTPKIPQNLQRKIIAQQIKTVAPPSPIYI